eukprot:5407360-Ditylum_brightwellii.AAC.1
MAAPVAVAGTGAPPGFPSMAPPSYYYPYYHPPPPHYVPSPPLMAHPNATTATTPVTSQPSPPTSTATPTTTTTTNSKSKSIYNDASLHTDPTPDTRRNRGGVTEPFPEKLHRMLHYAHTENLTDIVSFFPHGRAFAIHKASMFVSRIMPNFFRQTRLTSFQRQLNLYGFKRIGTGPDTGGYYHELFLKGRPGLCVNMKRTKVKGTTKLKRDADSEPNFYAMNPVLHAATSGVLVSAPPPPPPPAL